MKHATVQAVIEFQLEEKRESQRVGKREREREVLGKSFCSNERTN